MKRIACKTCRYWKIQREPNYFGISSGGICDREGYQSRNPYCFDIVFRAHDDSGLDVALVTGEEFFCAYWSEKTE